MKTWPPTLSHASRGFTLMEVMVVVVLSGLVTLGLVVFYLNAQAMWAEASTQALAQRDATNLMEFMRSKIQVAHSAIVTSNGANDRVTFYDPSNNALGSFYWEPADSLVHYETGGVDQGPVMSSLVERFWLTMDGTLPLLTLDTLRVRSTMHQTVQMSTTIGLYNGNL